MRLMRLLSLYLAALILALLLAPSVGACPPAALMAPAYDPCPVAPAQTFVQRSFVQQSYAAPVLAAPVLAAPVYSAAVLRAPLYATGGCVGAVGALPVAHVGRGREVHRSRDVTRFR